MTNMNASCHIWVSHVTYKCIMSTSLRHVTYKWVMSHMNESCHIWMSHVIYEWVIRHIWMSHVTYEWVTSHMNEFSLLVFPFYFLSSFQTSILHWIMSEKDVQGILNFSINLRTFNQSFTESCLKRQKKCAHIQGILNFCIILCTFKESLTFL